MQNLALVVCPMIGGYLCEKDLRLPYAASSILGLVSFLIVHFKFRETLPKESRKEFTARASNPLSFLQLFSGNKNLAMLCTIFALQTFPLFMGNVPITYAMQARGWGEHEKIIINTIAHTVEFSVCFNNNKKKKNTHTHAHRFRL